MTIQPTAVYPPNASPAQTGSGTYNTYNTRVISVPSAPPAPPSPGRFTRWYEYLPEQSPRVNLSSKLPMILQNRSVIFHSWVIAMVIVGFDEWHNHHILPRPARLWDTSLFYGLILLFSIVDVLVPLANVFAVGYTFTLLWQYYNGNLTPAAAPATSPAGGNG